MSDNVLESSIVVPGDQLDRPLFVIRLSQMIFRLLISVTVYMSFYGLLVLGGGLALWGWLQAKSFLKSHESIRSQSDFDEFKRIAKTNMYLAVAILFVGGLVLVFGAVGVFARIFGCIDGLLVFLILGPIRSLASVKLKNAENQIKAMPVEDDAIREEFDLIVRQWTSSAFPDW